MRIPEGAVRRRPVVFVLVEPPPPIGLERAVNVLDKPPITLGKPTFDRGRFVTSPTAYRPAPADQNRHDLTAIIRASGPSGGLLSATWEGGNRANPNPAVTAKIGATKNYKELVEARDYWDMRQHGKIRCGPDITYAQESAREQEDALADKIDRQQPPVEHRRTPPPLLLLALLMPLQPAWFVIAVAALPVPLSSACFCIEPDRCAPTGAWSALLLGGKKPGRPGKACGLRELLSKEAIERSRANDARGTPKQQVVLLDAREELELARKAKAGDIIAANKIILAHLPITKKVTKKYCNTKIAADDLMQEGVFGLKKALDAFDPEIGKRFSTLAEQAVEWAIMDYRKKQRRHYALSLDAPISDTFNSDTFKDLLVEPNPLDLGERAVDLDGLNDRERLIIEARQDGKTRSVIGAELSISDERVRQLEARAVAKLKKLAARVVRSS